MLPDLPGVIFSKRMDPTLEPKPRRTDRARWIAAGFIGAFAASVFTVIYTGLNVEGSRAEFDVGFRPVTLAPGEQRTIELVFDSPAAYPESTLDVTLPPMLEFAAASAKRSTVALVPGSNSFPIVIEAREPGSGYLVARVEAGQPVGLYRVFVTVTE
jgi:hypothetical protein